MIYMLRKCLFTMACLCLMDVFNIIDKIRGGIVIKRQKLAVLVGAITVILCISGCSSAKLPITVGQEMIISREHQRVLSTSAENSFKKVSLPNLSERKVFIEVVGMSLPGEQQIKQEQFIRSFAEELVAGAGGQLVDSLTEADIKLIARVNIFGGDITSHGIPAVWFPLFYRDKTFAGTVSVDIIVKDEKTHKLITSQKAYGGYSSRELYFLFFVGPFHWGH